MQGRGIRKERETIVNFNEEDATATIWTASAVVYKRLLKRLGRTYVTEDGDRHAVFTFPKRLARLPIASKPMSKAQQAVLDRARALRPEGKTANRGISGETDGNVGE
jgi:hypothetical protein